jgi:hypothetical protein
MSIVGDLLTVAAPTQLLFRRGCWSLEIVRLVPLERNVFQPRVQRVEGCELVLKHLRRTDQDPALASAASVLFRRVAPDHDCSFEAVDGDWVASKASGADGRQSAQPDASAIEVAAELRAELRLLGASHIGLQERVARLESMLESRRAVRGSIENGSTSGPSSEAHRSGAPSVVKPAREAEPARAATAPAKVAEPAAEVAATAEATAAAQVAATAEASAATEVAAAAEAAAAVEVAAAAEAARFTGPGVKLPPPSAVSECLHTLIGKRLSVREKRPLTFPPKQGGPCWLSRLVDDADTEVGAIISDLGATVGLGGALMMIPSEQLDAQRSSQTPSDDVTSAMGEVANNLSATINKQPAGAHVRVRPLELFTEQALDWIQTPALALELEIEGDMGRLFLFVR